MRLFGVSTKLNGQVKALQVQVEAQSAELASIDELRNEVEDLVATLGLLHTREGWNTMTTFEEDKKSRRKSESQEESG